VAQTILVSLLGNTQITRFLSPSKVGNEYYVNVRMADADRQHVSDWAIFRAHRVAGS